jgi:hypothetical protein
MGLITNGKKSDLSAATLKVRWQWNNMCTILKKKLEGEKNRKGLRKYDITIWR